MVENVTFVVLAKKNFGANPILNKRRLFFGHAPFHFASVQQDFSESVKQPLQWHHTKGRDLCAHVELWKMEQTHVIFFSAF